MKKYCFYFLTLLLFFTACRGSNLIEGLGVKLNLIIRDLPNGLKVVMVEDPHSPVVSYQTWVKVGSVDEVLGKTGLAHFFEHLMFKGTPKFSQQDFFKSIEAKGAEVNAFTTRDYTVYYETFIPELLPRVIELEADRLTHLEISKQKLEIERQIIFEERSLRTENNPQGKMQEALWALAYRKHPYRFPVVGLVEDLISLSLKDVQEFYKTYYHPAQTLIVVTGKINIEETWGLIKKFYGNIPKSKPVVRKIALEPPQGEEHRLILRDQIKSRKLVVAYHVPSARDKDSYAIDVLSSILFDGVSSRAYRRLVEELSLFSEISGSAYTPTYPGLFIITGTLKDGVDFDQAEKELYSLMDQTKKSLVTDREIQKAVRRLTIDLIDGIRSSQGLAQLIGTVFLVLEKPEDFNKGLERYLQVTAKEVQSVAEKYLHPNDRTVIQMVPENQEDKK